MSGSSKKRIFAVVCLLLLGSLVFLDRALLLTRFSFKYLDEDQALMWYGAREMAELRFHEPRFYGQAYHTMVESLLAVPLLKAGLSYQVVFPIVTSSLALFPFLLLAWLLQREEKFFQAATVLTLPVLLPLKYGVLTSISRGFVPSLFFVSLMFLGLFNVTDRRAGIGKMHLAGLGAVLSIWASPISMFIVAPLLNVLYWVHQGNRRLLRAFLAGCGPGLVVYLFSWLFYRFNWRYDFHHAHSGLYRLYLILGGLREPDRFFDAYSPVLWGAGWLPLVLLVLISGVLFIQRKRVWALSVAASLALMIFLLGMGRLHEPIVGGIITAFYTPARIFVGLPLMIALGVAVIRWPRRSQYYGLIICVLGASATLFAKQKSFHDHMDPQLARGAQVDAVALDELQRRCRDLRKLCDERDVSLIVVGLNDDEYSTVQSYGCPCVDGTFPETLMPGFDRRTWRLREEVEHVHENILFLYLLHETPEELLKRYEVEKLNENAYLVLNNDEPTIDVIWNLEIFIRRF